MIRTNLLLALFLCGTTFVTTAQKDIINNFTYLKSSGTIPAEFLKLTSDKFKDDYNSNKDEDLDKEFFKSTRFVIDELLLSGNVLFNEDLSDYVNKVAKYVLRREKKIYNSLQFYVLKSNTVNAFSTDQGIIFVTTGLLAQLENEAQLAYILAHEIAHFTQHHVRNGYVERQNIVKGKGRYHRLSYEDKVGELSVYSKDNELDADEKGIKIFLDSEYDIEEVYSSFGVLLYSYLPFEDLQFDTLFFNTDILYVPGNLFPDTINQITREEDFDDHLSSHPNIKKRMDAAIDIIGDSKTKGTLKYKFTEELFFRIRTLARFESVNLHLANRNYVKTIYNVFLLNKEYPNNKFLEFALAKALYGLAKYKNHQRFNEVVLRPKKIEGELYRLAYFIKNIKKEQINVLAYRNIYDLSNKYKNDPIIKKYERDMVKEFALYSTIKSHELLQTNYLDYNDSLSKLIGTFDIQDSIKKVENSDLSKYKKIKLKKKLYALEDGSGAGISAEQFHLTGLADIVASGKLKKDMEYFLGEEELLNKQKEDAFLVKQKKKKHTGLGIKKVVVVDPYLASYKLNDDKDDVKSEKQKIELNKMYSNNYNKLDLQIDMVDSKSLTNKDVVKYNEIGLLYSWVSEEIEHDDIEMISSSNEYMQELKNRHGTEHFLFSGFLKSKDRHQFSLTHFYGMFFVITAPIAIADLLIVHHDFEVFAISMNTETDKIEYNQSQTVSIRANKKVMEAYVYNLLYQLNTAK